MTNDTWRNFETGVYDYNFSFKKAAKVVPRGDSNRMKIKWVLPGSSPKNYVKDADYLNWVFSSYYLRDYINSDLVRNIKCKV